MHYTCIVARNKTYFFCLLIHFKILYQLYCILKRASTHYRSIIPDIYVEVQVLLLTMNGYFKHERINTAIPIVLIYWAYLDP